METKRCSKCGEEKPIVEFYRNGRSPTNTTRRVSECKNCTSLKMSEYYKTRREDISKLNARRWKERMGFSRKQCYLEKARRLIRGEVVGPHCSDRIEAEIAGGE